MQFLDLQPRLMSGPTIGRFVILQVTDGMDGIREIKLGLLHAQCIRT
jgi:hypothetical protein